MAKSYDYATLFRASVGFDRVSSLLENGQRARWTSDWPPYDIVKTGDDSYRISIAVAGFAYVDPDIRFQSNLLTVIDKKQEPAAEAYLHRGIAGRPFAHRFELADHVGVNGADIKNGLLSVDLFREVPGEMKPGEIAIETAPTLELSAPLAQIEVQKAACANPSGTDVAAAAPGNITC